MRNSRRVTHFLLPTIGAMLLWAADLAAQPPLDGGAMRMRRPAATQIFGRFDENDDGKLTEEELPAMMWQRLAGADADGDGAVSKEEFAAMGPSGTRAAPGGRAAPGDRPSSVLRMLGAKGAAAFSKEQIQGFKRIFGRLDTDGDGKLTRREYVDQGTYLTKESRAGIFRATDRNSDDILTEQEYVENRIITDEAKELFAKIDADQDRRLTEEEFVDNSKIGNKQKAREIFKQFDTDGDGAAAMIEYLIVWGNLARIRQGQGVQTGDPLPDVTLYDADGKQFKLGRLKGQYSVLVFGCLT